MVAFMRCSYQNRKFGGNVNAERIVYWRCTTMLQEVLTGDPPTR